MSHRENQIKRVYVTYCSRDKAKRFKKTKEPVSPDQLYVSARIQGFMRQCKAKGACWAIFSDEYGVWFPEVKHPWYEKKPDDVTFAQFALLLRDFDEKLSTYAEIYFYHTADKALHQLYACLLERSSLAVRVKKITDLEKIA